MAAANPLDAWGTGIDADRIFRECFRVLHDDPDTAAVAFVVDLTRQGEPYDEGYLQVAKDVFDATTKPFCVAVEPARARSRSEEAAYPARRRHPRARGDARRGWWRCGHLLAERDAA